VRRQLLGALILSAGCATSVPGQQASPAAFEPRAPSTRAADDPRAFLLEALGGSVGSLVGIGIVGLTANCGIDDLACVITSVGAGGALGVVGATIGTVLMAQYTGADRSALGALLGAVVGTGAGLGVHYLVNRASDRNLGDAVVIPIFVLAQGTFAAIGSRVIGRSR
jgi:hypothetical protein